MPSTVFRPRRSRARGSSVPPVILIPLVLFAVFILHRIAVNERQQQAEQQQQQPQQQQQQEGGGFFPPPEVPPAFVPDPIPDTKDASIIGNPDDGDITQKSTMFQPGTGSHDEFDSDLTNINTGIPDRGDYHEIFSLTSRNHEFIPIFFEGMGIINPSIVPHPSQHDLWVTVADKLDSNERVSCTAGFLDDILICTNKAEPVKSPLALQLGCTGARENFRRRIVYGPEWPVAVDGLFSEPACVGLWVEDARMLLFSFLFQTPLVKDWREPTRLLTNMALGENEDNFFLFWDSENKPFVQYNMWPVRKIAPIGIDGTMGEEPQPSAWKKDRICMAKYMPEVDTAMGYEWIEQGTNSLQITMCKRRDPKCIPSDSNTFIMYIFNHVLDYDDHVVHEPYVIMFKRTAPFGFHAISQRPIWISGRGALTNNTGSKKYAGHEEDIPPNHFEDFRITSINWRSHYQKYHGHIDDTLFLTMTIEETRSAVIDVKASDLVEDLGFC